MSDFDLMAIQEFADESRRANCQCDVVDKFRKESKKFGFEYFVALSLCDLSNPPEDAVWVDQSPKNWDEVYIRNDFQSVDPYFDAAVKNRLPFVWSEHLDEVSRTRGIEPGAHDMLDEAAIYGYGDGISIPMLIPGTHRGCVSLTGDRPDLSIGPRHTVHLMAIYLFEACLRLNRHAMRDMKTKERTALTEREREMLHLLSVGFSAPDISDQLKISERTVHFHVGNAKTKLGANNVTHAVVKAMLYGQLEP